MKGRINCLTDYKYTKNILITTQIKNNYLTNFFLFLMKLYLILQCNLKILIMETKIFMCEDLKDEVKLKFYNHIKSIIIKERNDMGVTPFSELTTLQQNNDVLNRINYFYLIIKKDGFYHLLEKTNIKHSV